jgi:two-component system, sensor histidine kinase and response regulator
LRQPVEKQDEAIQPATEPPSQASTQERVRPSATLLVVDDSEVNRTVIHDFLALAGYRTDVVGSGAAAIVATAKQNYDCILMDLQMPEMDGVETMRQIVRQCRDLSRLAPPVIALTAHATDEHRNRCLKAGMRSFLVKPIDSGKLIEEVIAVTGKLPSEKHYQSLALAKNNAKTMKPWQRKMLAAAGNDEETLHSLVEAFLIEVPQLCESLSDSLEAGDVKTARRAAHTLKSCLKYVAPTEDHQAALDVEMAASLNDLAKAKRLAPQAISIAEKWVRQVEAEYSTET